MYIVIMAFLKDDFVVVDWNDIASTMPYTKKIIGLPNKESDELLERIFRHQEKLDLSCRFKWTENAVAILDNRCTQHYAIADFYPGRGLGHERIMDRIAIVGDQPF